MSARQIANAIDEDFAAVCKCLRKMLKYHEVKYIELDRFQSCKILGENYTSRRMRFFFSINIDEEIITQDLDLQLAHLHSQ